VNNPLRIGFIGFGEAGSSIAAGLRSAGIDHLHAFDIRTHAPDFAPTIQKRAAHSGATLVDSSAELAANSDILMSTVTASSALDAARQTLPHLEPRHIYADLNSVSPGSKRNIEELISASGVRFVEAAIMAPVPPNGHRVPMLLGGAAASQFAEILTPFGMRFEVLPGKVGTAVAVKMCRSIVVKGLEALLVECVLAAGQYEADERVFASLNESFPGIDWKKLADYMVGRVVVHGERRAREMEEVAETLRDIGVEPIMAEAAARRQDWSALLDLRSHFGPAGPSSYDEFLNVIRKLRGI
jgi:3-hydroxyisobutyrate dehydrogenase-like beta-hydroxyacid dehydrogenase